MKLEASLNYFKKRRNKVQIMEEECAIYALEKQIPCKLAPKSSNKAELPDCGQKIDWSEVEK